MAKSMDWENIVRRTDRYLREPGSVASVKGRVVYQREDSTCMGFGLKINLFPLAMPRGQNDTEITIFLFDLNMIIFFKTKYEI